MEHLIKQTRLKFSGVGQDSKQGTDSIREEIIPIEEYFQEIIPIEEYFQEDKKEENRLQRQFSGEMSRDYEPNESEFATALAAAAFAIYSAEEASSEYQKKLRDASETPMSRLRTRKEEDQFRQPESTRVSNSMRFSFTKDAGHVAGDQSQKGTLTRRTSLETKADAWERAALAKIRKRYEKKNSEVLAWENEKKMKAKLQIEREKRELELKSAVHLQHYQNKLARIDHVVGGARVQMEEKRRSEESEVKEKAKRIRSTGKVPVRCFCF